MPDDTQTLIEQLSNPKSDKRRSAAKKLRKLGASEAGSALLTALKAEVRDTRSWETQYQMIMAIGECGYKEALPFLHELLSNHNFGDPTMQYCALGDVIVRLEQSTNDDATPVMQFLDAFANAPSDARKKMALEGALRTLAMKKMKPDPQTISEILSRVSQLTTNGSSLPFWVLAAAAGWDGPDVQQFVQQHSNSTRADVREAALCAQSKKYGKWNPL